MFQEARHHINLLTFNALYSNIWSPETYMGLFTMLLEYLHIYMICVHTIPQES